MKRNNSKTDYKFVFETLSSNKAIKTLFYVGAGIASLYLIGKSLSIIAGAIRGINDFKSAINGN